MLVPFWENAIPIYFYDDRIHNKKCFNITEGTKSRPMDSFQKQKFEPFPLLKEHFYILVL
jgi:hypothetical protein